ncbi:MAG: PH domain-containing protein [Spirochaetales bacterium]|nr:PH domain-containing protein [Spirochaetales bacterium]
MDELHIDDMILPPDKNEQTDDAEKKEIDTTKAQDTVPMSVARKIMNTAFIRTITSFLKKINIYRRIRESLVSFYLSKTVAAQKKDLTIAWQPPLFIILKITVVAIISYKVYELHPIVGNWFKIGLDFFKLHEIYNFTFPPQSFFDSIASYLFLFIIAYHGIYFLYHQIQALFSVLVINDAEDKVYYIKNFFIKKDLFIFSIPDISLVVLKQNIISRLFGLGTISLQKRSGEQVVIRTVQRAHILLKHLTNTKSAPQVNNRIRETGTLEETNSPIEQDRSTRTDLTRIKRRKDENKNTEK